MEGFFGAWPAVVADMIDDSNALRLGTVVLEDFFINVVDVAELLLAAVEGINVDVKELLLAAVEGTNAYPNKNN